MSYTPVYSPASLGSLERQHLDLKSSLKATLIQMGEEFQSSWMRKLPYVLLGRRTAYHADLEATPAQVLFGEDPKLPGEINPPVGAGETVQDLLARVRKLKDRKPAQTNLRKTVNTYMPPAAQVATKVYTKKPKTTPLGASWDGPYPIVERQGKSCLKLKTGEYANGEPRTEIRHWKTCYPAPLDEDIPSAKKGPLGRKPLNAKAKPFNPTS